MKENGYEYIDLGLPSGTMWATCNVGADKPEDFGLLFQFGRVDGYKFGAYNQFRTKDKNKRDTGSENIPLTTTGKVYKENDILDLMDDAAHVHMGGKWRMPSEEQLEELINNTTHDVVKMNGIKGMMITSDMNEHQLFIPFMYASWYDRNWENYYGNYADIWCNKVHISDVNCACRLYCNSCGDANICCNYRNYTFSVRGVFIK